MKTKLFLIGMAVFFAGISFSGQASALDVTLAWDPSPTPDVTYRILYGEARGGPYTQSKDVGVTLSTTVTGLVDGTKYFFVAIACDVDDPTACSGYSNQVARSFRVPAAPANLRQADQ